MHLDRERAFALLVEFAQTQTTIRHGLAMEAALRAYAGRFGGEPDLWGIVGLLHDFDNDIHTTPETHPLAGAKILRERGYPEEVVYAILTHADYLGLERKGPLEKALSACDELTGFITAVALVRPHKSILEVDVAAVKKKMKDKAFARAVSREDIMRGAQELGVDPDEHIGFVIVAMQGRAVELGLQGSAG